VNHLVSTQTIALGRWGGTQGDMDISIPNIVADHNMELKCVLELQTPIKRGPKQGRKG